MERYMRNQESLIQTLQNNNAQGITRLEVQISQLAGSLIERPKESLPSQPLADPRNSSQAHLAQKDQMNQYNLIHTLRSGKQVDNQVSTPSSSTQASTFPSPTQPPSGSYNTEKDKSVVNVNKSIAPYPNRLKNK